MNNINPKDKPKITARLVEGHRVASGLNGNPRFPGGTLRMQTPHFQERGLDISKLYVGTLNVSIAPLSYRVVKARHTFTNVNWHPTEPAEDFSFFDVRVVCPDGTAVAGYYGKTSGDTLTELLKQHIAIAVDLIKGRPCPSPRIESETHIMFTGSARPLEDAFRIAQADLVHWLAEDYGLETMDAYQLVTQGVLSPLANVCDTNYTSVAKLPRKHLPKADAMGGADAKLRSIAAEYRRMHP